MQDFFKSKIPICFFLFLKEEVSDCHSVTSGLPSVTSTAQPEVQQVATSSKRTSEGASLSTKLLR